VAERTYRLVVQGELSDTIGVAFDGLTLTRHNGNTTLAGAIRDQAELQGLQAYWLHAEAKGPPAAPFRLDTGRWHEVVG
jgi:hypothetical protein